MFKKLIRSEKRLKWLTWLLSTLALVLVGGFLFTFVQLRSTLSTGDDLSEFQELNTPRNIAQLQRELLRLQSILTTDDSITTSSNSFSKQRNLVEGRMLRLEEKSSLRFIDGEAELKLKQARTEWDSLQLDLDSFQSNPQDTATHATLTQNLSSIELIINDALRIQSFFMTQQKTDLEKELATYNLRLGINNSLGVGALASALGLYVITQQQKRKVMGELQMREQRLQTLVRTIPDVILRVDYTGRIIDYEPNEQIDLGIPFAESAKRPIVDNTFDQLMRPQLAQELQKKLQMIFATNKSVRHEFWVDLYNDGNQTWFQASGNPINEMEAIITIRDITEDKQHRKAIQKAQRMESLSMMAGGVAHNFNGLLTIIRLNMSMLQRRLAEEGNLALKKCADDVFDAAVDASNLTEQLLAYAGKSKLQTTRINLNQFLDEHDAIIQATVTSRKRYIVEKTERIPSINADASQLQQMVMNLVINASDATESGSGCITVRTGTADFSNANRPMLIGGVRITNGQYVTLEVQDNGTGISPYMFERIFEPYFSTHKTEHSGLGLSATLGMIRSHAGGITIESGIGEGTIFCLYFPAQQKKRSKKRGRKPLFE